MVVGWWREGGEGNERVHSVVRAGMVVGWWREGGGRVVKGGW